MGNDDVSLRPLTKKRMDGNLYVRRPETTATLVELEVLSREEIVARLAVGRRDAVGYISNECLLYLLRTARSGNNPAWFDKLFAVLDCRVRHNLSGTIRYGTVSDPETVREEVLGKFHEVLAIGLGPEPERLDPYEAMFDGALASLRKTTYTRQRRLDGRKADVPAASDGKAKSSELAAPAPEEIFGLTPFEFQDFRTAALAAIERLPEPLRETVRLVCQGDQTGSTDPDKMTIAKQLDVDERTVRNRIKRAVRLVREQLEGRRP
ncbi:RNA polymerase sigma factor [Methylobacterium sp. Gmos1]